MARVRAAVLAAFGEVFDCELRHAPPGESPLAAEGLEEEEEQQEEEGARQGEAALR